MSTELAVCYSKVDGFAIIRVNNPPVNALSQAVRQGLEDAVVKFLNDSATDIAIIVGEGRTFIAGADISEFEKPLQEPFLPALINQIEAADKPIVAVLHGTALGGGLEVALGAHYRVALSSAKMGLPEVNLGILPGAGGTQRLPRLTGVETALGMITSGRHIGAAEAENIGLVDQVTDEMEPLEAGLAFARQLRERAAKARRICDMHRPKADSSLFDQWRENLKKSSRGQLSPIACVDAVQASTSLTFEEGLKKEREIFSKMMASPQREGLIHAFFSERSVAKLSELKGISARPIEYLGVVGGGTMGVGIAVVGLLNGLQVTLLERSEEFAGKAMATVSRLLGDSVRRKKITEDQRDDLLTKTFAVVTDYSALSEVDLVIEAVFEDIVVKQDVFKQLDEVCKKGAVLATNTSYLDINSIAAVTNRPQDVIGLHFFSPAHVMKLLEVVVADKTELSVVATGFALAKKMCKVAVRAGVCDGFIGNRILANYRAAADYMVLDGASPYQIDRALVDFGFAMGPFAVSDLAGLDIGWVARKRKARTASPQTRTAGFIDRICELGRFGQKTGHGFYIYEESARRGTPDPEVEEIIANERAEQGIEPREFCDAEIVRRYMAAMINEAAKVVDEGIARRPLDVDVTFFSGYGFPRYRGGPMKYADHVGLENILADLEAFAEEDDFFWQPADLIKKLVAARENFDTLNK